MNILQRNNVNVGGSGQRPLVFAHGFGCDQQMWRFVAPAFETTHRTVLFDLIGCGLSDLTAYDDQRHASLHGYAQDLAEIIVAADLHDAVLVGHSVSAMISMLAARLVPGRVSALVMIGPSPRYLNDPPDYVGGFERADIDALLDMIEGNLVGWANFLAPVVMGAGHSADMTDELKASFCALDPHIARRFAEVTFLGDNRADLAEVALPTLIVQVSDDAIAPRAVGEYLHHHLRHSEYALLDAAGHCPHMTHPEATIALIRDFLARV
jgi:sigma-B regulation protein RsbQ